MPAKNVLEHKYTVRTHARTTLASALLASKHVSRIARVGLVGADLTFIKDQGEAARLFDTEQQSDLVLQRNALTDTSKKWQAIAEEEDALRMRLPAVVDDLCRDPATRTLGEWLSKIGFETYRIRTSAAQQADGSTEPAASAETSASPTRERVARKDRLAAALQLSTFTEALLDSQRAPILTAFEARAFDRDRLSKLAADARAVAASLGNVRLTSPDAGRLESEAAGAQKQRWESCRRMIRAAVAGDQELERLWAQC